MEAAVLERYLLDGLSLKKIGELTGRDPSTIERTLATPVFVAADERHARAIVERQPAARRMSGPPVSVDEAAERLQPFIDAGFSGFTFNNSFLADPDEIAVAGELLRLVG